MSFTKTARILGVAACAAAALHAVPAEARQATQARTDTGALVSKGLTARTVLTSTSGKKLTLTIGGSGSSTGSSISIGLTSGRENHTWSFQAPASALKFGSTGVGTLVLSSAQTGNRGRLSLKFSPSGTMRTRTCNGKVASKSRPVAVSGIAFFKTGTRAWGNVGKATRAISFSGARTVSWTYDVSCATPPAACTSYLSWNSWSFGPTVTQGVSGTRRGTSASAMGFRSTTLAVPKGASRTDIVTVASTPLPTFTGNVDAASVTAKLGAGSVTVAGQDGFAYDIPCGSGSTASLTQWSGTATNGSTAFRIPAQVFGAFAVPNGTSASITRQGA
jgi:hypothetical protein